MTTKKIATAIEGTVQDRSGYVAALCYSARRLVLTGATDEQILDAVARHVQHQRQRLKPVRYT